MADKPHNFNRREFLIIGGAGAVSLASAKTSRFNQLATQLHQAESTSHFIPIEKNFDPEWVRSLTGPGEPRVMEGDELKFIGMPIGGVCAGQINIGGDGQLWLWSILNQITFGIVDKHLTYRGQDINAGSGANYVDPPLPTHPFEQGFSISYHTNEGKITKKLQAGEWKSIRFRGEYPMAFVEYEDPESPVRVTLEAYSPFVPLETDLSTLPCVILDYRIENTSGQEQTFEMCGWMQNYAGHFTAKEWTDMRAEATFLTDPSRSMVVMGLKAAELKISKAATPFETFHHPTYGKWKVEGEAFGPGPMAVRDVPSYQGQTGAVGPSFATSFNPRAGRNIPQADAVTGRLISPTFEIKRKVISFRIAGGNQPGRTCLNLVIDGKIVRTQTGLDSEVFVDRAFDVSDLLGQTAHIEIVDQSTTGWGHVAVELIQFEDHWPSQDVLNRLTDGGQMSLTCIGDGTKQFLAGPSYEALSSEAIKDGQYQGPQAEVVSALSTSLTIPKQDASNVKFIIGWSFPNLTLPVLGRVGHRPSERFRDQTKLIEYLSSHKYGNDLTTKWHDTWYDSTLPRWFLDRVMATTSTLATMTSTQFANRRFYGWEGIGCCNGTCGHVYQYAQAMARLFPDLERSVREMVDFGVAFHADSGLIEFRGEYGEGYAVDSQAGYILRALREHQMSPDSAFLKRLWPRVKKALQFMINQDRSNTGILTNRQHNTLDVDMYGPSSWLSSLYLAALLAGREMASELGDVSFKNQCQRILDAGYKNMSQMLWNGEYFISKPAPGHPDSLMYGDGCEVDQVMGQWWCWQLGLRERLYDQGQTLSALQSIYKYNYFKDVGPFRDEFKPGRWYAMPGEGGLIICSFPRKDRDEILGKTPTWASMYFDECMTGFEYEVAGHMIAEGMVEEGLAVIRTVHDRYAPIKRNPWNEVECSDHYARCMAVYGAFITLCGFEHHGPKGHIGFDPKLNPESFRAPFTACTGWGTYRQDKNDRQMEANLILKHGTIHLNSLQLRAPKNWSRKSVEVQFNQEIRSVQVSGSDLTYIEFEKPVVLQAGDILSIHFS